MIIYDEPAEKYQAREAVSAGFLWRWVSECPAQAYYESVLNPDRPPEANSNEFDIGKATHLLTLEGPEFAKRASLIPYETYQTKESRDLRDQCYIDGRSALRPKDYKLVVDMHRALGESDAAEFLFGTRIDPDSTRHQLINDGRNEVTYTWEIDGVPCKARADRIIPGAIIDLKTATSASPQAFQRAMIRDGHHLRAAWYSDGLAHQDYELDGKLIKRGDMDYLFIVVAKTPPHLVEVYRVDERALGWGRSLYQKALREFRRAREANVWPGYSGESGRTITNVLLPAFAENALIAQERAGVFDHDEDDVEIGY